MRLLGALAVRDELGKEDWALLVNLKRKFEQHYGEVRRPQLRSGAARSVCSVCSVCGLRGLAPISPCCDESLVYNSR